MDHIKGDNSEIYAFVVCRARGRPDQKRTETLCGTPGGHGVNVPVPVEEVPRTPSDDASVPSKATSQPLLTIKPVRNMCDNVVANTADDAHVFLHSLVHNLNLYNITHLR